MRRYAIADVRGEIFLLKKLIDRLGLTESDKIIFLGSYLGPGPSSRAVLDFLLELKRKIPGVSFLKGCYEWVFGFCIAEEPTLEFKKLWSSMGGSKVFHSYADERKLVIASGKAHSSVEIPLKIPENHIRFMEEGMHQWYEDDIFPYVLTHSGGHPALYGGQIEREEQVVFGENGWWEQDGRQIPGKTVVFSHVPFKEPFRKAGKLGLDLGAGYGGRLAAFEMVSDAITIVGG